MRRAVSGQWGKRSGSAPREAAETASVIIREPSQDSKSHKSHISRKSDMQEEEEEEGEAAQRQHPSPAEPSGEEDTEHLVIEHRSAGPSKVSTEIHSSQ